MKKVVLIGASGFVGSAILNEALNRGFHVTAVVRHPEKIKIENENLEVKRADVSSLDEVSKVCKGAEAGISAFNPGWNNPDIYKETMEGNSHISVEDYAAAMIDELEKSEHHQERFTIGY